MRLNIEAIAAREGTSRALATADVDQAPWPADGPVVAGRHGFIRPLWEVTISGWYLEQVHQIIELVVEDLRSQIVANEFLWAFEIRDCARRLELAAELVTLDSQRQGLRGEPLSGQGHFGAAEIPLEIAETNRCRAMFGERAQRGDGSA